MALIAYILLVFLNLLLIKSEDCVLDRKSRENLWEKKLHKDLQCNYKTYIPPDNNKTHPIDVTVKFVLKTFKFDDKEDVFRGFFRLFVSWYDSRLEWDPSKYDGLSDTQIYSFKIWMPGLQFISGDDPNNIFYSLYCQCFITHKGHVSCTFRMAYEVECSTKLKDWPYDTHNCTLKLGEYKKSHTNLNFTYDSSRAVSLMGAEIGAGWYIVDLNYGEENKSDSQLYMTLTLERQAFGLTATIVVPSIVLSAVTLTSVILNVDDHKRLGIVCFGLINHFMVLREINENIPKYSSDTPKILLFVRGSLILTMGVILLTFLLISLKTRVVPSPVWINLINNRVLNGRLKYIVYPRWQIDKENVTVSEELDSARRAIEDWSDFANIVNSVSIIIVVFVYVGLFSSFMPKYLPPSYTF